MKGIRQMYAAPVRSTPEVSGFDQVEMPERQRPRTGRTRDPSWLHHTPNVGALQVYRPHFRRPESTASVTTFGRGTFIVLLADPPGASCSKVDGRSPRRWS